MPELTLEQRVEALEKTVAELKAGNQPSGTRWWEQIGRPMSNAEQEAFDRMVAYGQYFRKTGRDAPQDWKPGDPIPEPDET
jgi:hypothetical protein